MTFPRVKPSGWSVGEKLTSAQQNQLDTNVSNSLDKTGDSITSGNIHISAGGRIWADGLETIVGNFFGAIQAIVAGGIASAAVNGITSYLASGITPGVAGGISDGGLDSGILATTFRGIASSAIGGICAKVAAGITDGGVATGISATVANGITTAISEGIQDGGFPAGITATTPGGVRILDHVVVLGAVSSYTVDSSTPGVWDDVVWTSPGTACAVLLPASPVIGRRLKIVFPTVAASGGAGAGGSINTNSKVIFLSGVTSGAAGTYPASPSTNHNLTYDLRYVSSGWLQVNGQA